jgi:hypothetical protein
VSNPQTNRTLAASVEQGKFKLGEFLGASLNKPKTLTTDYKRYKFQFDPWDIVSTNNIELMRFTNLNLTVARTQDVNPSSFFIFSFDLMVWYRVAMGHVGASLDIHFFDVNNANFLDDKLDYPSSCGQTKGYVINHSIDPKYFDSINGALIVLGAGSWQPC